MRSLVAVALALVGCDKIFDVDHVVLVTPDADLTDAPPDSPQPCATVMLPAIEDTYLDGPNARGASDTLIVENNWPTLLKFDLGANLQPDEHIASAIIHLSRATRTQGCGEGACASCAMPSSNSYFLYWMITTWSQAEATAVNADATTPWHSQFANGALDRSALVLQDAVPADVVDLPIPETAVAANPPAPWIESGQLAIQLVLNGYSTYASSEPTTCAAPAPGPRISLTICRN